jgi:hypothetical protein
MRFLLYLNQTLNHARDHREPHRVFVDWLDQNSKLANMFTQWPPPLKRDLSSILRELVRISRIEDRIRETDDIEL